MDSSSPDSYPVVFGSIDQAEFAVDPDVIARTYEQALDHVFATADERGQERMPYVPVIMAVPEQYLADWLGALTTLLETFHIAART